ncbi:MAG TPA: DUF167 domain-containing protein [Allosphingosinicella sp.]|nr:DUF167 domain-containing protein [Allosphingosinicella sp.]
MRLAVRVTPRAKRDALAGLVTGADGRRALAVKLAAPPADGAANKALCIFLAKSLGMATSHVTIRSGQTSRHKIVMLAGDVEAITSRLEAIAGDG